MILHDDDTDALEAPEGEGLAQGPGQRGGDDLGGVVECAAAEGRQHGHLGPRAAGRREHGSPVGIDHLLEARVGVRLGLASVVISRGREHRHTRGAVRERREAARLVLQQEVDLGCEQRCAGLDGVAAEAAVNLEAREEIGAMAQLLLLRA